MRMSRSTPVMIRGRIRTEHRDEIVTPANGGNVVVVVDVVVVVLVVVVVVVVVTVCQEILFPRRFSLDRRAMCSC